MCVCWVHVHGEVVLLQSDNLQSRDTKVGTQGSREHVMGSELRKDEPRTMGRLMMKGYWSVMGYREGGRC